jgi:hypothetical protein
MIYNDTVTSKCCGQTVAKVDIFLAPLDFALSNKDSVAGF